MARRLAAILAADVVGYSRLMGRDEVGTLEHLKSLRKELVRPQIIEHKGRIVKLMGDGLLAEFPSVVDAVRCAVTIQLAMSEREASVADGDRIAFRIGVNLGDIIVEGDDIYGEGVNVASRLEGLAEPGGICVSRTVVTHVRGRVASAFDDLGERRVKNILEPVHVFRVHMTPEDRPDARLQPEPVRRFASVSRPVVAGLALALVASVAAWLTWGALLNAPKGPPSIAVLPFDNLSVDPQQEHLADGITNDLITGLARVEGLAVIAANSSFVYKDRPVDAQRVGEELDVRYVLEGSVQRSGDAVRINAQLIDAATGRHLWADKYDTRDMGNFFEIQDEVVAQVVSEMSLAFAPGNENRVARVGPLAPDSYDLFAYAKSTLPAYFAEDHDLDAPRRLFAELVRREPVFAGGHAGLSLVYSLAVMRDLTKTAAEDADTAMGHARQAVVLDPDSSFSMLAMANALQAAGQLDDAVATLSRLVRAAPSSAAALGRLGLFLTWAGRAEDAVEPLNRAIRLDPYVGSPYLTHMGLADFTLGRYEAAAAAFEKNDARGGPIDDAGLAVWTASYNELGRTDAAEATLSRLVDRFPGLYLRDFWLLKRFQRPEDRQHLTESFRRAGISWDEPYTR